MLGSNRDDREVTYPFKDILAHAADGIVLELSAAGRERFVLNY